jgi:hypothetical protein
MIKTILVPLTGHKSDEDVLETAYLVARLFDAHLECLHISPGWRTTAQAPPFARDPHTRSSSCRP